MKNNKRFFKNRSDINYSLKNTFYDVDYRPEFDTSDECTKYKFKYFQKIIVIIRLIIELDRIYISFKVS